MSLGKLLMTGYIRRRVTTYGEVEFGCLKKNSRLFFDKQLVSFRNGW